MTEIDSEDDASVTASMLTKLDSHMCIKSFGDLSCVPLSETPTSHDHSRMSVDLPSDNIEVNNCSCILYILPSYLYIISVQVTCHPVQDTDNDEDLELLTFESYCSPPAYRNNEVNEIFELLGTYT